MIVAGILPAQERFGGSDAIDRVIEEALAADQMPGAVAWIGQNGKILHRKAYGNRSLTPAREPMTLDTIFDAASLTKVVATTSLAASASSSRRTQAALPSAAAPSSRHSAVATWMRRSRTSASTSPTSCWCVQMAAKCR